MADRIKCSCCNGKGTILLTGVYAETLKILRRLCRKPPRHGGYCVANVHQDLFGCNATALNNRLDYLEKQGFAKSYKFGRQRRFVALRRGA